MRPDIENQGVRVEWRFLRLHVPLRQATAGLGGGPRRARFPA